MNSVSIQIEDFDFAGEWRALRDAVSGEAGAVVAFAGLVRDRFDDQIVRSLFLEHYPGMTERSIERIMTTASTRFGLLAVRVIHRVGELYPGDQVVLVLCAASHRAHAFEACQFVMDYLKTDAIFWKKETSATDAHWVRSTTDDQRRVERWKD